MPMSPRDARTAAPFRVPNVAGQVPGRVLPLGFGSPRGTLQFGPLGTTVACPGISDPNSRFRNSGFRIADVNLEAGSWTIRLYARSTVSGEFIQFADIPIQVGPIAPQGPINFQAAATAMRKSGSVVERIRRPSRV